MNTYGTVLTHEYETVNENGETVSVELKLCFNAMTLVIYQNYLGRELMTDFVNLCMKSQEQTKGISKELLDKFQSGKELTLADINEADLAVMNNVDYSAHMEFFINLMGAMVATREYPKRLDFMECIAEIPPHLVYDGEFCTKLVNFVAFALKKNGKH